VLTATKNLYLLSLFVAVNTATAPYATSLLPIIASQIVSLSRQRLVAEIKRDKIHNYRRNSTGFCLIILRRHPCCPSEKSAKARTLVVHRLKLF